jgi:hypothetical protein
VADPAADAQVISRRRFLEVGLLGTATLALPGCLRTPEPRRDLGLQALDGAGAETVAALAPVILAGALPAEGTARTQAIREVVDAFDRAILGMPPSVQSEVQQLLGLLAMTLARGPLTGIWRPLREATAEEIAAFLEEWRHSRFDLLRAGYQALNQLTLACWYGLAESWAATGYPGPPRIS